jgi:hypothetical protein
MPCPNLSTQTTALSRWPLVARLHTETVSRPLCVQRSGDARRIHSDTVTHTCVSSSSLDR